jgi:hypothetical protein
MAVGVASAGGTGPHTLTVTAETPAVTVGAQPSDRHFFNLPSLEYVFQLEARCAHGWSPESLSLSVADRHASLGSAQLHETPDQQIRLQIPAKQIAPVVLRDFCVIDRTAEGSEIDALLHDKPPADALPVTTVIAALSAHASLRCSSGGEQKTVYVSQPLDVTLACDAPGRR